ncbi:MAG: DUF1667 domain-containing protein [Candidatus Omnitrophica bacterium]|nr:DUF1667 domain-containing protein [Candidatus Omnitrophota bacterium]
MIKKLICIECPKGCVLSVETEEGKVIAVSGNECPKGARYATSEIENPLRVLTTTVLARGLCVKMVPVKTDRPIPKDSLSEAMTAIKRIRLQKSVRVGEVVLEDLLGLGIRVIATRDVLSEE